jgi:hypothetical protein
MHVARHLLTDRHSYEQGEPLGLRPMNNMYSCCTGVFGGIIVGEDFLEYFNYPSPGMQGFVTSVYGGIFQMLSY